MVHFNEKQKWYWLPDQEADEVLTFKAVDSDDPSFWRESPPSPFDVYLLMVLITPSVSSWRISSPRTRQDGSIKREYRHAAVGYVCRHGLSSVQVLVGLVEIVRPSTPQRVARRIDLQGVLQVS
jgi:hypothetical protein